MCDADGKDLLERRNLSLLLHFLPPSSLAMLETQQAHNEAHVLATEHQCLPSAPMYLRPGLCQFLVST